MSTTEKDEEINASPDRDEVPGDSEVPAPEQSKEPEIKNTDYEEEDEEED